MSEPRIINAKDACVGDRICISREFTVLSVRKRADGTVIAVDSSDGMILPENTWTLLSRPEPPREPGSRWEDPETGARYVKTLLSNPKIRGQAEYVCYSVNPGDYLSLAGDDYIIARLIPLDPS